MKKEKPGDSPTIDAPEGRIQTFGTVGLNFQRKNNANYIKNKK
jgi:hypothetical protein